VGLILVGAVVLAIAWFLLIDSISECDVAQHASLPSPDGSKQAVMFDVDCGATTGFNTQVAIGSRNVEFDRETIPPVLVLDGKWSLPVRWIDDRTLHIRIPKEARIYSKLTSTGDVTTLYEEDVSPP
jgi:hypothetical protein